MSRPTSRRKKPDEPISAEHATNMIDAAHEAVRAMLARPLNITGSCAELRGLQYEAAHFTRDLATLVARLYTDILAAENRERKHVLEIQAVFFRLCGEGLARLRVEENAVIGEVRAGDSWNRIGAFHGEFDNEQVIDIMALCIHAVTERRKAGATP